MRSFSLILRSAQGSSGWNRPGYRKAAARDSKSSRLISLGELMIGAVLVIGHNVFHVLPNEVFILFALFWISPLLRQRRWEFSSLRTPESWWKTLLAGFVAAAVLQIGSELLIDPLVSHIWPRPQRVSSLLTVPAHDWKFALKNLAIVWSFAAFGEELGYRGYLLTRAADLGHRSKLAYIIAMVYVATLFGFGHFYKGPAGVVDSTYSGLVLGTAYLLRGNNLWVAILAHGLSDTYAVLMIFLGWT